ncbi:MAG: hypothetical protein RIT35_42 [Pseudomonadota bacterium]|jgi:NADH:ubiquinone oxidoreductase subunit
MIIGTKLDLWMNAKCVGCDAQGNRYFLSKKMNEQGQKIRSILYKGAHDASRVPPLWHSWLHYTTDEVTDTPSYKWSKERIANNTGTNAAYHPTGHNLRPAATGDYQPWNPNKD